MKALITLWLATSACTFAKTFYLASGGFVGDGSAPTSPWRVSDAASFDSALAYVAASDYSVIILGEGIFETRGIWNFPIKKDGSTTDFSNFLRPITIKGAGMRDTIIRLSADAVTNANNLPRADLAVMRFGVPWQNNSGPYLVEDLTVDGNQAAFKTNQFVAGGLIFHSNNVTVRRVRVINLRGSFGPPDYEAFGILVNSFDPGIYPGPDGGNLLEECVVESNGDVEDYVSPFYISTQERMGRPLALSRVLDCKVIGIGKKATRLGVSFQSGVIIERFYAHNVVHAIYNDVKPVRDAIIRNSRFTGVVYTGPFIVVDTPKERILVEGCTFNFAPESGKEWIGLTVWDKYGSGSFANDIRVRDCIFRGASTNKFTPVSIKGNVSNIEFTGNVVPTNTATAFPQTNVTVSYRIQP